MLELAQLLILCQPGEELPAGVIVVSAVIEKVSQVDALYEWHLTDRAHEDAPQTQGAPAAGVVRAVREVS